MGEELLQLYKSRVKKEWKLAFISVLVAGLLIHIYLFTNSLQNHDSIYHYYSNQDMVMSGRWFLTVACGFSSYFNLPWITGMLSLLYIALTAVVLVSIFKLTNPVLIVLMSALLVSFPSIVESFHYEFTADGYMMAMLLAALSVRLSLPGEKRLSFLAASAVCLCLSCACYQAYVSFAMVLSLAYLIIDLLEGKRSSKEYLQWMRNELIIYICAMASYLAIWRLRVYIDNITVTHYMGISTAAQNGPVNILQGSKKILRQMAAFFFEYDSFFDGLTNWNIINAIILVTAVFVFVPAVKKSGIIKRRFQLILLMLSIAAIPFAIYIWYFASENVGYAPRMEQSICVLYILLAILADRWLSVKRSSVVGLLLCIFVFNNSLTANIFYFYMQRCMNRSYATAVEMATRMHELDDGTIKQIAISGHLDVWGEEDYKSRERLGGLGVLKRSVNRNLMGSRIYAMLFLEHEIGFELSYYIENPEEAVPYIEILGYEPVPDNWEFRFPIVTAEMLTEIEAGSEYRQMPCWPAAGSVKVINDTIVVKLSDM